ISVDFSRGKFLVAAWTASSTSWIQLPCARQNIETLQGGLTGCGLNRNHELVGAGELLEVREVCTDVLFGTNSGVAEHIQNLLSLWGGDDLCYLLIGEVAAAADDAAHAVAAAPFEVLIGCFLCLGAGDVDASDDIRLGEYLRGLEILAVVAGCLLQVRRREVGGKGIRQAVLCGSGGAKHRGA